MAGELHTLGVPFPDVPPTTSPAVGQPEAGFWIANEPETRLFLGQHVMDHKDDHAYQVYTSSFNIAPVSHHRNRTLFHL
jgi:hypothetical protein